MENDNKEKEQCTIQNVMCSLTDDEKLEFVKQLRKESGWGMMDCKRALNASNWEVEDAKSWLIQYRKKSGIMFD